MMLSLAVFVAVSLCSAAHAQRSCLSLGVSALAKCNFYEGDSAVCNIHCDNQYQGQYTSTNGGQYQPALPWCVSQLSQRKSCLVFNRGGFGQCTLYPEDSAECDISCNNNYQGRFTAGRSQPYQPALPSCVYQPAYGPTPAPGPRPRKCNLKLYYYSYAQCYYDNNSDSSYCDVSCNNQYAGRYTCNNGGFYSPSLPWCVDQVDKPTVQENPFPIKANQNSPKSQPPPFGLAAPGGPGKISPVLAKAALLAPPAAQAKIVPILAKRSVAEAPEHKLFADQVKGSALCLPPGNAPEGAALGDDIDISIDF